MQPYVLYMSISALLLSLHLCGSIFLVVAREGGVTRYDCVVIKHKYSVNVTLQVPLNLHRTLPSVLTSSPQL